MQGDDPPYLSVGTAVSAKYKGAFCEAKVSKVVRLVKCKVTYKMGLGTATVTDEFIKGPLRVGQTVQAKHSDKKEFIDATITKIQDCSQYTVVFDDGDITTLRRSALCLKSGRHFNESETLDQLPLTHPEHFGNPVVGGRRGRRLRQMKEDSSDGEVEEENESDLELYSGDIGRVVCIETSDKKRSKDNWFPGLVVIPSAQPTVRINAKDEFLVRSFKDGRYYTVPKKEVSEFTRDMSTKVEGTALTEAVEKVLRYLDNDELPAHWERSLLFNIQSPTSESDDNYSDSSEEETCEEKDHFVAQLIKFMDDSNTPLNKSPMIGNKDVDLHRLFRIVEKQGGYNRVTNKKKWRSVTLRMKLPNNVTTFNQVKQVYKKCLLNYEAFYRTLGVTMLNHSRTTKKSKGRSLIRDKDRTTPVNSPRPDKEDELLLTEKKEQEKLAEDKMKIVKRFDFKPKEEEKRKKESVEVSDTNSSDATDQSEAASSSVVRSRRLKLKTSQEQKVKSGDVPLKAMVEKGEEQAKKQDKEDEKSQQTRSKQQQANKVKETTPEIKKVRESKTPVREGPLKTLKAPKKGNEEEKKRGRKKLIPDDKPSDSSSSKSVVSVGDKLKVYYGPTHESKVTYEAKVIEVDKDAVGPIYLVHYTGWNTRYDEWITNVRIAENLSATTKAKRLRQQTTTTFSKSAENVSKPAGKRGRGMSITGRSTVSDNPRSVTPSIIPSSRTTPATRTYKAKRLGEGNRRTRLTSTQTEPDNNYDSESESEGEFESATSRLDNKTQQTSLTGELKTYRRKLVRTPSSRVEKRKDDEDAEKEDDEKNKRFKKVKKTSDDKSNESDDENSNPPKGRDFDLNQIRSELKGFVKSVKSPSAEIGDAEGSLSSDESSNNASDVVTKELVETGKQSEKVTEKNLSSDDIYEFKEPEPFEFESRTKTVTDEKIKKRLMPRVIDDFEKSPKKKGGRSPLNKQEDTTDNELKRYRKTPVKKSPVPVDEDKTIAEDPFDKLIESPSFHSGREKTPDGRVNSATRILNLDEPLSLFRELPDITGEESRDILDLSDNDESPNEPIFTRTQELFPDSSFAKISESIGLEDSKLKDSDDDEAIRASIQSVIEQSSLAEYDSGDELIINQPTLSYQPKKKFGSCFLDTSYKKPFSEFSSPEIKLVSPVKKEVSATETSGELAEIKPEVKDSKTSPKTADAQVAKPEMKFDEPESKTKITDKIKPLMTVNKKPIKSENPLPPLINELEAVEIKSSDNSKDNVSVAKDPVPDSISVKLETTIKKIESPDIGELKPSESQIVPSEQNEKLKISEIKSPKTEVETIETKIKIADISTAIESSKYNEELQKIKGDIKIKDDTPEKKLSPEKQTSSELRKRSNRKIISKEFIEDESDSDSSDSDKKLIIARSDNDSPTNIESDTKIATEVATKNEPDEITVKSPQFKEPNQTEELASESSTSESSKDLKVEPKTETEDFKEEENDSHLHSLLLCEETIPGSPTPPSDDSENVTKHQQNKSVLEMPFASAPGNSNNTSKVTSHNENKNPKDKHQQQPIDSRSAASSTVLDNTPPTTPESTISNLSPRGDNEDLSPNTVDNDSYKSTEAEGEYSSSKRRGSTNKIIPYIEEDTLMNAENGTVSKKTAREDSTTPASCKKRRRSCKTSDDIVPAKRGRKPANRSRHNTHNTNSDSDDMSENSMSSNLLMGQNLDSRPMRSPRPSKYNFFVELDPSWDSGQRISLLQQKLQELRKTYADVKSELATIERRRKKIRRREREAKLAAKQQEAIVT